MNAAALATLALAPAAPRRRQGPAPTSWRTTPRWLWQANPEPDLAGYRIVWRETTAAGWQGSKFVGNVTEATVSLSKDNYFFGVQAVDKDGNVSVATYPAPLR